MNNYSNPTANGAIGAVDREIRKMCKQAEQIMRRRQRGLLTPEELAAARKQFVGIHALLLREALED